MSDSVRPHRQQPTRLPHPWDSPGKNTGVGCHFLLQCMKVKSESEVAQSCPTLCDPIDGSLPGSPVPGILQARTTVGCHFLLQCMKVKSESEVAQSCLIPSDPMDCSPPGSSIRGSFQAGALEGVPSASPSLNSSLGLSVHPEDGPAVPLHLNSARSTCQLCGSFLHSILCWIRGPGCVFMCIKGSLFHSISTLLTSGSTLGSGTTHSGGFILKLNRATPARSSA